MIHLLLNYNKIIRISKKINIFYIIIYLKKFIVFIIFVLNIIII